jgi:uncharacterized protein DUF1365
MELVYLLGSIISNTATSILLSLLLLLRVLFHRLFTSLSSDNGDGITLYEGVVWHERRRPVHHSFEYKVRYALIDLDRSPQFPSSNHLSAHQARTIAATSGPVLVAFSSIYT